MEFGNAFPAQVHSLELLVYDMNGKIVDIVTETSNVLADENWRMLIDLNPGKYILKAWGGIVGDEASFHFTQDPKSVAMDALQVAMNNDCMTSPTGTRLNSLFFGELEVDVPKEGTDYTEATVNMKKDTNNIRILLDNLSGIPLDGNDFIFTITDDNTLLNYDNSVIGNHEYTYSPWIWGQESAGVLDDGTEALLAYAEFSTSRLIDGSNAKLLIQRRSDSKTICDIPLVNFLLLLKSQEFKNMGKQEFLDRESRWTMVFFLDGSGSWIDAYLKINDWIVRINNAELE